jgi:hypothetical protein
MRRWVLLNIGAVAMALALAPRAASAAGLRRADQPFGPRNAVAIHPFAFFAPGFAVEYERFALPRRLSVVSAFGLRSSAGEDYSSLTISPGLELRCWLWGRSPWSDLADRAMVGPYVSIREDVSFTTLDDDVRDRLVGTTTEFAETLAFGWRFTVWRFAVTQSHGVTLITQVDPSGRLAPTTYPAAKLGLTLGYLF